MKKTIVLFLLASWLLSACGTAVGALPRVIPQIEVPPIDTAPLPLHFQGEGEAETGESAEPDFGQPSQLPKKCIDLGKLMLAGEIGTLTLRDGVNLYVPNTSSNVARYAAREGSTRENSQLVGEGKYYLYDKSCGNLDTLQEQVRKLLG